MDNLSFDSIAEAVVDGSESLIIQQCSLMVDTASDWCPSADWFDEWKPKLQLKIVQRVIVHLLPHIELQRESHDLDQRGCVKLVRRSTLVGVLPVPHPIVIKSFRGNAFTGLWLTHSTWTLATYLVPDVGSPE